jgi:carboxymethylenebutenolidase
MTVEESMKKLFACSLLLLIASIGSARDSIKDRLENSPRHQEWAEIKSGKRTIHTFIVYPQKQEKATAVLVIHENKGLTDWVRSVADRLAEAGYIALAPDLLSELGPKGGNTSEFTDADSATQAIYHLAPDAVTVDLDAVADYALKLPSSNGKLTVSGFCWGGGQSFRFATHRPDLKAAFVFYGMFDYTRDSLNKIKAPVYGFYGGNDSRINSTLPDTKALMKELKLVYEPVSYEGADHAFMRKGEEAEATPENRKAHDESWDRWLKILTQI